MIINKKIFLFSLVVCVFLIGADFVLALEQRYPTILGVSVGNGTLPEYARYFFNIGMALAGTLAAIVIAFGGIYYLISATKGDYKSEAKEWIKSGVLGLFLIVSSYLIVYTINPNLVVLKFDGLLPTFSNNLSGLPSSSDSLFVYYDEIPVGTLTENLLSRTANCYDFDDSGNPIESKITTDDNQVINGPTLLNHDRVDCVLKLGQAAERKAELIEQLSDEIVKLMETCSCEGKCDTTCSQEAVCDPPIGEECLTGTCIGAACKPFENTRESNDCCPEGTKNIIEHGPIRVRDGDFRGLDEFRTQLTGVEIVNLVEIQPKPKKDGREITVINNGNCQICEPDNSSCQNSRKACLKKGKWGSLKLIEQLMYFREKMDSIKTSVEQDLNQLQSAEDTLGQCYLAEPYIDLLKTSEKTNKEDKTILVQKTFNDPETQKQIDIYKYCKGFEYANSNAYSQCQNICPETLKDKTCYQGCNEKDPKKQTQCLKNCYDNRECPADTSSFSTFKDCVQGLGQQCLNTCTNKYSGSQEELQKCQEKCGKDSKCLLDNEEKCTVDFQQLKACTDSYNDPDNLQNCISNSFMCKYGSDEYAGYPDCTKTAQEQYSSPFLYKKPDDQRCKNPYEPTGAGQNCLSLYPEIAKCPTASECPKCPCGIVDETVNLDSSESGGGSSIKILEYQIVTGTCNELSYNDDPLTFYCQQNWWLKENKAEEKRSTPIGKERICSKEDEIPVGQTVDDSEKWANGFIKNIDDFTKTTEEMIQYIKKIVEERNYCQCDSTCEEGRPCSSDCQYVPATDSEPASCAVAPCVGISCQKIINLLRGGASENCPVEKNGIFFYYDKIYKGFKEFYKFVLVDGRTDILKELSYSRKKMDESSTIQTNFGKEIKILSCERAKDQIISPIIEGTARVGKESIKSYCYGKVLGKILKTQEPMADNWFACEERKGVIEEKGN